MRIQSLLGLFVALLLLGACQGDYRSPAIGDNSVIYVVMDSTMHNSESALALMETFGRTIETLPTKTEPLYNLQFRDFNTNDELDQLQKFKNIIFVSPIDDQTNTAAFIRSIISDEVEERVRTGESFAFPLHNQWYRDQWSLVLTSTNDSELADRIREAEENLVQNVLEKEFARWEDDVFDRYEQTDISDSLWARHGWKVRMQHDYIQTVDTTDVVVFFRTLPENNRWMWAWWEDNVVDPGFIDKAWINTTRDSLMENYIQGTREGSYVTTEYNERRSIITKQFDRDDRILAWETLGTWKMTNDFMGGPFVNFTYYDPATQRMFMVEYGQFAPSVEKRRFVQQFRAMGRTFEADSLPLEEGYADNSQITAY